MTDRPPTCDSCGGDPEPQSTLCTDCAWDLIGSWQGGDQ